jgi:hypothetical protein
MHHQPEQHTHSLVLHERRKELLQLVGGVGVERPKVHAVFDGSGKAIVHTGIEIQQFGLHFEHIDEWQERLTLDTILVQVWW